MTTTRIANAELVIAYEKAEDTHVYRRDIDVVFDESRIVHLGPGYAGKADQTIDGRGHLVMPGMVNVHSHPSSEASLKGITDEIGSPKLYNTSLYEYLWTFRAEPRDVPHLNRFSWCELLMSGVTTLVDLSVVNDGWIDRAAESGLRMVLAPMYRSGPWSTQNGWVVDYQLDEKTGRAAMDAALKVVDGAVKHPSGRLSGLIAPAQIDTCLEGLIRDSIAAAAERRMPIQMHAAQSYAEFLEIVRRTGLTPIQWLDSLGFLGPTASIGHCIFLDHHPWVHWPTKTDLGRLAETGTSVAHCPTVFARRGVTLRDLGTYLNTGINVGIGTDTYPHNMLEELRHAGIYARVMSETPFNVTTGQIFRSATLGGAKLLGRDDIGRLAVGAKPDVVLVDLKHPMLQPSFREPLRALIFSAAERAVKHVFVAGRHVVKDFKVTTMDYAAAAAELNEVQKRIIARAPELDRKKRTADELTPTAFRYV